MKIGCVRYLNARPLIYGWPGPVEFDHPSILCRKLARGELDVALVSSIEYLRRPEYKIVDGVSIAAFGPVYSVILAHEGELAQIDEIEIDPASETSVVLLRCLLASHGLSPKLIPTNAGSQSAGRNTDLQSVRPAQLHCAEGVPPDQTPRHPDAESTANPADAAECNSAGRTGQRPVFLIGDQAIRFREMHPAFHYWDLAAEWKNLTGLPFVFALWLIRPDLPNASGIAEQLRMLRNENLARSDDIIAAQSDFDPDFCRRYFRDNLKFQFAEAEKNGLLEFHRRALGCGVDLAPALTLNVV